MAIQFLSGLNVDGNINLNSNQIKEVRIDNLSSAPTGSLGRIYYDDSSNTLRLYNGAWVDLTTGADGNTTYTIDVPSATTSINLKGNDGTDDAIALTGSGLLSVTRTSASELTFGTTATANVGTVTDVDSGDGIIITGTSTATPTVSIDYAGSDNAILVAGTAVPTKDNFLWFSDASSNIKKSLISSMPGFGKDGTVTSVDSGAGLTGGPFTTSGTISVQYAGADNVVLDAGDGTGITVVSTDKILVSDADDNNAKFVNISQITSAIGGGTVQTVSGASTVSGITLTSDDDTVDPILTLAGTVGPTSGGTGQTVYTVGDMLYAGATTRLDKLGIGSAGQVLKVVSGAPAWAADSNSGGTVTSITPAGDNGNGTAITGVGTISVLGTGRVSTSISGTSITVSSTNTDNVGTVTSVVAGAGMTQSGSSSVNPTLNVVPAVGGGISVATNSVSVDGTVVRTTGAQSIADTKTFTSNIVVPSTPLIATNAASKSYVDSTFAGSGALIFQGGYNAATNVPDLDTNPSALIKQGWTYAVTKAGDFFTETVEDGDLIIAESDAPTTLSDWTVVQNNVGVATGGTTDGGTTKGIAGFDSAIFDVSANGWVQVKTGGITDAMLVSTFNPTIGSPTNVNTSGVDVLDELDMTNGVVTRVSKRTLPTSTELAVGVIELATEAEVRAGTVTDKAVTPATLATSQGESGYTTTFPSGAATTFSIAAGTHKLGTGPLVVQVYDSAKGIQQFMDVQVDPASGDIDLAWTTSVAANTYRIAVQKIS